MIFNFKFLISSFDSLNFFYYSTSLSWLTSVEIVNSVLRSIAYSYFWRRPFWIKVTFSLTFSSRFWTRASKSLFEVISSLTPFRFRETWFPFSIYSMYFLKVPWSWLSSSGSAKVYLYSSMWVALFLLRISFCLYLPINLTFLIWLSKILILKLFET